MAVSPAIRVGIIVFLAALLLTGVIIYLQGYSILANSYPITVVFTDAQGLQERDIVSMAGVEIGYVDKITLDENQRAVVDMRIHKRHSIPEGSRFVLQRSLLAGQTLVNIIPNREAKAFLEPGVTVTGEVPVTFEDLLPQGQVLLANLIEASEDMKDLLADEEFKFGLRRTVANAERASARLEQTIIAIQKVTMAQQDEIETIVRNVEIASENVRDMTAELERFAKQEGVQGTVRETLASAQRTTESLERTVTSLETLVTDPQFQEDIRVTVATTRRTVEEAERVVKRAGGALGGGGIVPRVRLRELNFDALYRPDDGRVRGTLNTTLEVGRDNLLDLGWFDVGAGNKLILQPRQPIGPKTDLLYGIYASRLGVGLDHNFSDRLFGTLNLYDSYDPRLDIQTGYMLGSDLGVLLGVDNLGDDNQLTMGVRFTR